MTTTMILELITINFIREKHLKSKTYLLSCKKLSQMKYLFRLSQNTKLQVLFLRASNI